MRVRSLGCEIEKRRDPRNRDLGFEIPSVSAELLEKYNRERRSD
jgi:hypothetical protein